MQVGKFLKNNKRPRQIRCAGGIFFKINKRADQNKTVQRGIVSQKHSQNTTEPLPMETIRKIPNHIQSIPKALPKALPKHYQTTPKQGRIARCCF